MDNTTLNKAQIEGGDVIATDDIAGAKYQRVKLIHGADGVNAGDVSTANPYPIQLRNSSGTAIGSSTDEEGHVGLDVAVHSLEDSFGFSGQFNPVHSLQVAQPYRLAGTVFGSAIDANFWTATTGTGGASGVANSVATVASGTAGFDATNGWGKLASVRSARFIFAHPMKFRAAIQLTALAVSNSDKRGWGPVSFGTSATVATPLNGPYFSVDAAGVLSVNYANNGTSQSVASGSFNGTVSQVTLDLNVHAYEIIYFTMGIWFFYDGVLIHKVIPTDAILYNDIAVPIGIWSKNNATGGTTGVVICWNAVIVRLGRDQTAATSYYVARAGSDLTPNLKLGGGNLHGISISNMIVNSVVTLYDNTSATGTVLWSSGALPNNAIPFSLDFHNAPFYTGLSMGLTGANCNVMVQYE